MFGEKPASRSRPRTAFIHSSRAWLGKDDGFPTSLVAQAWPHRTAFAGTAQRGRSRLRGEPAHAERFDAALVGQLDRRAQHPLAAERRSDFAIGFGLARQSTLG